MRAGGLAIGAGLLLAISACGAGTEDADLVAGKQAFVAKCGACHTLSRAGTTGVTGPNLDVAFGRARTDGLEQSTFQGVVSGWVKHPNQNPQTDPVTGKALPLMPADIVTGRLVTDVAAYVASAAGKRGEDDGRLATVGVKRSTEVAKAEGGALAIPADPSGALAYEFGSAEAEAGAVKLNSKNEATIDHNIAVKGNGIDEKGPVVKGGATSTVEAELDAGEYTFYCSVPGHEQGGMLGKLTVK